MGFVALIFALVLEQGRPLPRANPVHRLIVDLADLLRGLTDAGEARHGVLGWFVLVGGLIGLLAGLESLLAGLHPIAVFGFHVLVLYFTLGFRQFSHAFTSVQLALVAGDITEARRLVQQWLQPDNPDLFADDLSVPSICRLAISNALVASHRHVFGPLFWYLLLPGAIGPVLYRLAQMLAARWAADELYGQFAQKAYRWIDWLPTR
ncbi:MAG: cobalamin biosynthesis protein, partial [Quisquiliibacterium sp.]